MFSPFPECDCGQAPARHYVPEQFTGPRKPGHALLAPGIPRGGDTVRRAPSGDLD
jgi:hypothetical protein